MRYHADMLLSVRFRATGIYVNVRVLQQITDPSSRQRGRYMIHNRNCLQEKLTEKEKLVAGPRWTPDTKSDWPTDCRS
jgi:hypothetical protein